MAKTKPLRIRVGKKPAMMASLIGQDLGFQFDAQGHAKKQGPGEKEGGQGKQQPGIADDGHMKNPFADQNGHRHIGHADTEIGNDLAENQFRTAQRGADQLLHGPGLPFPGHGGTGEQGGDDDHDQGDDAGNEHILAAQVRDCTRTAGPIRPAASARLVL